MGKPKCSGENHQFIYLQLFTIEVKQSRKNVGEWYNQTATNCKKERRKMWVSGTAKQPQIAKKREEKFG